jgi:hypothetical protein
MSQQRLKRLQRLEARRRGARRSCRGRRSPLALDYYAAVAAGKACALPLPVYGPWIEATDVARRRAFALLDQIAKRLRAPSPAAWEGRW